MDTDKLLGLYPPYTSVLGPYLRKDGRKHIVLNNNNVPTGSVGKTKTISYPKALMEIHLDRRMIENETVDHIDRNHENDDLYNLQVIDRSHHAHLDVRRVKVEPVKCPMCETSFTPTVHQRNRYGDVKNSAGPFCSRKCSGYYGSSVQNGGKILPPTEIVKTYYQIDK